MGTGTFLLNIIDSVADTIRAEQGDGAVGPQVRELFGRLIGFEQQVGPYAVAQLRIHQALKARHGAEIPEGEVKLLVADTLADPYDDLYTEQVHIPSTVEPIAHSRREANRIKLKVPIDVVIGNPPYGQGAGGLGGWIEAGSPGGGQSPPLDAFRAAGRGKLENVLSNMYVYFWRWATWKVFDAHAADTDGIIAFITPSSFTTGAGYAGMREYLRRNTDEGWIIDLSPEHFRSEASTRVFPGVPHKLSIAVFARYARRDRENPARIHYIAAAGDRQDKFGFLAVLDMRNERWADCGTC
jgi:predicted helicase